MSEDEVAQECVIHSGLHRYGYAVEHFARFRSEKRAAHNLVGSGMRRQVMEHQRLQNHTLS